jgi:hypothetical protein
METSLLQHTKQICHRQWHKIWKPLAVKTSNNMKSKLAKFLEVPNSAQNLVVSAISRHCVSVLMSKFSTRLKLILPVLHTAGGNILSYERGAQNTDNLSILYWHQLEGVNRSGTTYRKQTGYNSFTLHFFKMATIQFTTKFAIIERWLHVLHSVQQQHHEL